MENNQTDSGRGSSDNRRKQKLNPWEKCKRFLRGGSDRDGPSTNGTANAGNGTGAGADSGQTGQEDSLPNMTPQSPQDQTPAEEDGNSEEESTESGSSAERELTGTVVLEESTQDVKVIKKTRMGNMAQMEISRTFTTVKKTTITSSLGSR